MSESAWVVVAVISLAVSCVLAGAAGRFPGAAAWGLVGPAGWVVAALVGIQRRIGDDRLPKARAEPRHETFACPHCDGVIRATANAWGRGIECPQCRRRAGGPAPAAGPRTP
jgi:hypothetical protein